MNETIPKGITLLSKNWLNSTYAIGIVSKAGRYGGTQGKLELNQKDGYSPQNLWFVCQFRLAYEGEPILQQLVREIPWGQNILIYFAEKCLDWRKHE